MMKEKILVITCIIASLCFAYQAAAEDVNIALYKPAEVSSMWDGICYAYYAVDDIYPAAFSSIVHTGRDDLDPWWKVDLQGQYEITTVVLWNRQECCQDRMRNMIIEVLDKDGTTVNYGSEIINPDNVLGSPMSITYTLDTPTVGKYIQVRRIPDDVIGDESTYILCVSEVRVFGDSVTAWNPDPADSAIPVTPSASLSWSQPTAYTPTNYDIAYGTNSSLAGATVVTGLTETTYDPAEDFGFNVTYYWRVDSYDGATKYEGEIWSFTSDGKVGDPDPADGAARVGQDAPLMWRAVDVPGVTYDVYFQNVDANEPLAFVGNVATNSYNHPEALDPDNAYAWRIDAICSDVNTVEGDLWSYTTGSFVTDPSPADSNSVFTATDITLSWIGDREGDTYIDAYDVYFGSDPVVEVTTESYQIPYELTDETTYTWRVDTKHDGSVVTTGDTWEFTTGKFAGHWPFNNNLNDVIGDNDGERSGSPAFTDGFIAQAVDFADDLAQKPVSIPLNAVGATASWSFSVWEYSYTDSAGSWETILGNGYDYGWETFEFGRYEGNRYILGFSDNWDYYRITPDDSSYLREGWHFHAISYDSGAKKVDWYINGSLVTTYNGINLLPLEPELFVGNISSKGQPFNGKVDELKLYSRPLSAAQVLEAYIIDSGFPFDPIPATGADDIPWDVTLEWTFAETPTGLSIEIGKETDLSDATPITLAPDATSFNVLTGLGVNLTPSTGYYWRLTAEYPDKTAVGPTWFFTVRDLVDLSGDLVVNNSDFAQMSAMWGEDSYEIVPAGTEFLFVDQEEWVTSGDGDPNIADYDAYVPVGDPWGESILTVKTDPTPDPNDFFTPPSQTLLWTAWGDETLQQLCGLVFPKGPVNFSDFDRFGFWCYQRDTIGNFEFRPITTSGLQPITKTVWNMQGNNDKWYKYEWNVGGIAEDIYKVDIWCSDNAFTIEYGHFYLVKDGVEVPLCFEENWFTEDVNNDCLVDVSDLALLAQDWLLDASND